MAQRRYQILNRRDFVAFLVNRQMGEDDLVIMGKGAHQMRRLAVVEGVEAAAQGLAIDRHADWLCGSITCFNPASAKCCRVTAERALKRRAVKATQNEPDRRISRHPPQRQVKSRVQPVKMRFDKGVNLAIGHRARQHRQNREKQDWSERIHFALPATRVRNLGKKRQKRRRHQSGPSSKVPLS